MQQYQLNVSIGLQKRIWQTESMEAQSQLAVTFQTFGTPDVLTVVSEDLPVPGPGEARIRVEASSVQWTDTMIRRGKYPDVRGRGPFTPGYDLVGVVDAIGPNVTNLEPGDRVADLTTMGANARYAIRPASGLTAVPATVDAGEATALVLSWMTAYQALVRVAKVRAKQRVLVVGGNGAVGLATIGLASALGFEVWATSGDTHRETLETAGAMVVSRTGWAEEVRGQGGVDVVIDGVGGDGFSEAFRALRPGGMVVAIGMSATIARGGGLAGMAWDGLRLFFRNLLPNGLRGTFFSITAYRKKRPGHWSDDLARLFTMLEAGTIHPDIAETLVLSQVADAHRRLEHGGLRGKLILAPWA